MKHFLYLYIYLIIYTLLTGSIYAQSLELNIQTDPEVSQSLIDSLNIKTIHPDFISLRKESDSLTAKLHKVGYIDTKLLQIIKENDWAYTASYYVGVRVNWIKIYFDKEILTNKEISSITEKVNEDHFFVKFTNIPYILNKLNSNRIERGNPFSRLWLSDFEKGDENSMSAKLNIDDGDPRTLDTIIIKGYEKFPRSYLTYYAGIKPGRVFNKNKLVDQNEILNNLGFVSTSKPPEVLFRKKRTWVYFYLNKENSNLFDGILGFSTNPGTQKLEFDGYLNLTLTNNLNFGEQLLINYKADGNEQQNFRIKTILPYILSTPIGLGAELKIFKRDSSFVTTEQQVRTSYQINPASSIYTGYKGAISSKLSDESNTSNNIEDYKAHYGTLGVDYYRHQISNFFPIKTSITIESEFGSRKFRSEKERQQRLSSTLGHIMNLNEKNSIFIQNNSSILISDTFLENELFRFGGIDSMRGFTENSIDATLFSALNTEYRYLLTSSMVVHSIIDLGYFENQLIHQKEKLYSFGLGFGIRTKAGIFRLLIANGKSEDQEFKLSATKIHLSLSSYF